MAQTIASVALGFAGAVISALVLTACGGGGDDAKAVTPLSKAPPQTMSLAR
jgi:hypothetical protein